MYVARYNLEIKDMLAVTATTILTTTGFVMLSFQCSVINGLQHYCVQLEMLILCQPNCSTESKLNARLLTVELQFSVHSWH